ncbi:glycoside hydrolase family 88 protein [Asticcacaulis machinosus]|uniref:Glycoside hydrolase family 88 protein n=1 Tax=Asticcacaulis machinosus TaxID=2984211 RepID=A0ABT5HI90_9CAUL|nr:glycoside hydrolase family 88 protein [Asticcacaulis machinosus]
MTSTAIAAPKPSEQTKAIPYKRAEVIALAEKVADYQLATMAGGFVPLNASGDTPHKTGWVQGALFVGLTDLADRSDNPIYKQTIIARGMGNKWQLGSRTYHADDHVIGQSYLWASRNGAGSAAIAPLKERFDRILAHPPTVGLEHRDYSDPRGVDCDQRWCWSDAIFMAPAAWLELSKLTGDLKYADYAKREFSATTAYLYDKDEHLYYRDSRFFNRRGPSGEKVFWSRGDGWVHAGLARMIPLLPEGDPGRVEMETVFKEMSAKLIQIQKPDGYWSPSLLADPATSRPESSGTGFFTYGLAWGIKAGLLDRKTYEPAVRKGWTALTRSVHPDGKLGYVQPVGDRPENVSYDDTQFYGVGAFLLAATAVADLDLKPGKDLTVPSASAPRAQAVLNVQQGGTLKDNRLQGGTFKLMDSYAVPADHFLHDGLMAFEGLGWESDLIGYRIYLDERMAIDIFGKRTPDAVLHTLGKGADDYHDMAPWGMDIFKVGNTVGLGSVGRLRDNKAVQLGKSAISVRVIGNDPAQAITEVKNADLDGGKTDLTTQFSIRSGSALTRVSAKATGAGDPFVTGVIKHPGVTVITSDADPNGWAYVATWGKQSLVNDDLGIAVFYKPAAVTGAPSDDGASLYVTFKDPKLMDYAFGAAWVQDRQGVGSLEDFRSWLNERRVELSSQ